MIIWQAVRSQRFPIQKKTRNKTRSEKGRLSWSCLVIRCFWSWIEKRKAKVKIQCRSFLNCRYRRKAVRGVAFPQRCQDESVFSVSTSRIRCFKVNNELDVIQIVDSTAINDRRRWTAWPTTASLKRDSSTQINAFSNSLVHHLRKCPLFKKKDIQPYTRYSTIPYKRTIWRIMLFYPMKRRAGQFDVWSWLFTIFSLFEAP